MRSLAVWFAVPALVAFGDSAPMLSTHPRRPVPVLKPATSADSGFAGQWEAKLAGDSKTFVFAFNFIVKGDSLTGTLIVDALNQSFAITNGSIKGKNVAFEAFGSWHGTLSGDEIKFTREIDDGRRQQLTARRVSGATRP